MVKERVQRRLAAILAADVVGYSRLMGEDEEGTLATLKACREVIDGLIAGHQGRVFGSAGDSIIAEFASPVEAARCATEIQLELENRNAGLPEPRRMRFRIGVNLGDVVVEGDNLMGDGVNVAARLESLARPGGVCISNAVLEQVQDRLGLEFEDLGEHDVKNIARPVRVYRVPLASEFLATSPFRGLDVFEYAHADIFHGRARAIEVTRDRLRQQADAGTAFLLIYGMSGSGKSSLMRAGLLPAAIKSGSVTGVRRFCVFRPSEGSNPRSALVQALLGETALPELARASDRIANVERLFGGNPDKAVAAVDAAIKLAGKAEAGRSIRVLVAVDQLEELFTTEHIDADERAAFIALLVALARSGFVRVIATIRTDFLHHCAGVPGLSELKDGLGSFELLPPTGPEIAQIIRNPARTAGLRFEEDREEGRLEDVLQQAAASDPSSLPLLEFVLDALYETGKERRVLTFADYRALGRLEGAIAKRAEEVVKVLPEEIQGALPMVLRSLTTIRLRDEAVASRAAPWDEIAGTPAQAGVVNALIRARLLVSDTDAAGDTAIRLAHEALLNHWPRARAAIDADREFLATRARVQADADRWLAEDRNTDLLLPPGKRLAEAEELLLERRNEVDHQTIEYVEASASAQRAREEEERDAERRRLEFEAAAAREREAATRRLAGRTRFAAIVTLILALAASAGAVIGFRGQQEATQQAEQARAAEQNAERQAEAAVTARDEALASERDALLARNQALRNQSVYLTNLSSQEIARGNATNGILLALNALPNDMDDPDRPFVIAAEAALYEAVFAHREMSVLTGHEGTVWQATFSPDGRRLVTASTDKTARVWDTATGNEIVVLRGHGSLVSSVAFGPDGHLVLTGSADGTARLWDAVQGNEVAVLRGHRGPVRRAVFGPNGKQIVTGGDDNVAIVWDALSGERTALLRGHSERVQDVAFSPNGALIGTVSRDRTARLWNAATGEEIAVLSGHEAPVNRLAFGPDSRRIVTASDDRTARLWNSDTGSRIGVLRGHSKSVVYAAFGPSGKRIVTTSEDGTARLWDAVDGGEIAVLRGHERVVTHAVFSPDGSRIMTSSRDGTARLWNAATGEEIAVLRGHAGGVQHIAVSADGNRIATASTVRTVRIWRANLGTTVLRGHNNRVTEAAFSPDERLIVTASDDGTARVWDAASGAEINVLRGSEPLVRKAVFSPDGRRVTTASSKDVMRIWDADTGAEIAVLGDDEANSGPSGAFLLNSIRSVPFSSAAISSEHSRAAAGDIEGTIRVWNTVTGDRVSILRGHRSEIIDADFSRDGRRIVTASADTTARIWDAESGQEIAVLTHDAMVLRAAFSPDGTRVATGGLSGEAHVWDANSGAEIARLSGHFAIVTHVTFSPDGNRVLTAGNDQTARLWDASSGSEITVLGGHLSSVNHATFSPDGRRIATASNDGTVRLWDAVTGDAIAVLQGHANTVHFVAFSPSGTRMVSASDDKTARLFDVFPTTQALIDHARSIVPRELTPCERQRFFLPVEGEVGDCPN